MEYTGVLRRTTKPLSRLLIVLLAATLAGAALAQPRQQPRPAPPRPQPPAAAQPVPAPAPEPLQRRITVGEVGFPAGAAFGPEWRELIFPLPPAVPGLAARLSLDFDLTTPFPARQALEFAVNGRIFAARAVPEGSTTLNLDLPIAAEDLAREAEALRLHVRLIELPGPAGGTATLRPDSHLALSLPDGARLSPAAVLRVLPGTAVVVTRPGTLPPAEAAAALRAALALAASGREARIAAEPPSAGQRLWSTGAVLIAAGPPGLSVVESGGQPALALGEADLDAAARALEIMVRPVAPHPTERPGRLPFSALRGSLAAGDGTQVRWVLDVSTRDLPPATRPRALHIELNAPPGTGGLVSIFLNDVLIGSATVPADGALRHDFPVPERLVALDNRIGVALQRGAPGGPAQLLPSSAIILGASGAPAEFLALPPFLAGGFEVLLDPMGGVTAETLHLPLWLLRSLVSPGAPVRVTAVEPGATPHPRHPFLAVTGEAPAGSAPRVQIVGGRVELRDRAGRAPASLPEAGTGLLAQLIESNGHPGIWLRQADGFGTRFDMPATPPKLDRGDVALLDARGVSFAWTSAPLPAQAEEVRSVAASPSEASTVLGWRPIVVVALWLGGFALVAYAFIRPRRNTGPA